jgi:acyl carrier protein
MTMRDIDDVRKLLAAVSPGVDWAAVGPADSLAEAGLDSLDKASFFLEVETATGVKVPDEAYDEVDSLEGVLAAVTTQG